MFGLLIIPESRGLEAKSSKPHPAVLPPRGFSTCSTAAFWFVFRHHQSQGTSPPSSSGYINTIQLRVHRHYLLWKSSRRSTSRQSTSSQRVASYSSYIGIWGIDYRDQVTISVICFARCSSSQFGKFATPPAYPYQPANLRVPAQREESSCQVPSREKPC